MFRVIPVMLVWASLPFAELSAQAYTRSDTLPTDSAIQTYDVYFDIPFGQTFINPIGCSGFSVLKTKTFDPMLRRSFQVKRSEGKISAYISWGAPSGTNTEGTMVENPQGRMMQNSISNLDYSAEGIENNIMEWRADNEVPVNLVMSLGMGKARLNLTGIHLRSADISTAETDLVIFLTKPNHCRMGTFNIKAGTSELLLRNIENAHAEKITIENGLGNTTIELCKIPPFPTQIYVEVGAGDCQVTADKETPIRVIVKDNNISSVELPAEYLKKGDNVFVNLSYQKNPENAVSITVDLGMGKFKIIPYQQ